jgi:muramoyltetrapeptide carboxypeptidase
MKIGVVAPASRITPELAGEVRTLAETLYPDRVELHFHPQCFESSGHFAGPDTARTEAFLDVANDSSFDAVWFARGGYGSGRIAGQISASLSPAARDKTYLGYSDLGFLLAGLCKAGCSQVAHGPMPADLNRADGEKAVVRALRFLIERAKDTIEPNALAAPSVAFNITVLSHLLGTPLEPDLSGLVLMLEDVSEHHYRIDRALHHITSHPGMRRVAGIRLGRCSLIPPNDPEFGSDEEEIAKHWCNVSGIPYLGRADIGHDIENKVVPFGHATQA